MPFDAKAAVKRTTPQPPPTPLHEDKAVRSQALVKAGELQRLRPALQTEVAELTITDSDSYLYADELLGRVRESRKGWATIYERVQLRVIKPIRAAIDELYALNRDVDKPLEHLETVIKTKMTAYKTAELRALQAAEDERRRQADELERQANVKAQQEQNARTAVMRERLRNAREALEQQAAEVASEPAPEPVRGSSSQIRMVKKVTINAREFCAGIAAGKVPLNLSNGDVVFIANMTAIERFVRGGGDVSSWPGVTVEEVPQTVGR